MEQAGFSGREIGILHSLREVPGFLAFTAIFILLLLPEQTFALLSLLITLFSDGFMVYAYAVKG